MSKRVIFKGEGKVGIGVHRRGHKGECRGLDAMDVGTPKEGDIKRVISNPKGVILGAKELPKEGGTSKGE